MLRPPRFNCRFWVDSSFLTALKRENDAWQLAVAECAGATIVARDRNAFFHLGHRYERFAGG